MKDLSLTDTVEELKQFMEIEAPSVALRIPVGLTPEEAHDKEVISAFWDSTQGSKWCWMGSYLVMDKGVEEPVFRLCYYILAPDIFLEATLGTDWGESAEDVRHIIGGAWLLHNVLHALKEFPGFSGMEDPSKTRDYTLFCAGIPCGIFSIQSKESLRSVSKEYVGQALLCHVIYSASKEPKLDLAKEVERITDLCLPKLSDVEWTMVAEI